MGDLNKGETFEDGQEVTAARLHRLIEDATLEPAAITDRSAAGAPAANDKFLVHDDSEGELRAMSYSALSAAIAALSSAQANKLSVAQTAHGLAVGDVIRRASGEYEKAVGSYPSATFTTTDVDIVDDEMDVGTNTINSGDKVYLTSSDTLPTPLVALHYYYAFKVSADVITLHTNEADAQVGTNPIDLTDVGIGNHAVYYDLYHQHQIGVVSEITDANNFVVVTQGLIEGLSGLLDGRVYYVNTSSPGLLDDTPAVSYYGAVHSPVLVATSTTTGIVIGGKVTPLSPWSVREEHIADKEVTRAKLSSELQAMLDRNLGTQRQTVLTGRVDAATGQADFLEDGTGLQVVLTASDTNPVLLAFANGFDEDNGYNFMHRVEGDQNFDSLTADSECFLYVNRDTAGALTYLFTRLSPEYGFVKSNYRTREVIPRLTADSDQGYVCTASHLTATYNPYKAFDGHRDVTAGKSARNTATASCWWKINLPYKKAVNKYTVSVQDSFTNGPASWALEGSDDDAAWTSLNSQAGISWGAGTRHQTFTFTNFTPYKYYRLNVTVNGGGATFTHINELQLFEACDHFYFIPEGAMYQYTGGVWVKVNHLFVGECRTGAASVALADVITYALRGEYASDVISISGVPAGTRYSREHNIGVPWIHPRTLLRYSEKFPWCETYGVEKDGGGNIGGLSVISGGEFQDPKDDRCKLSLVAYGHVIVGAVPHEDSNPSGALNDDVGQALLYARRSF